MVSAGLLSLLMATVVSAAPHLTMRNVNATNTKWTPDRKLGADDVIIYNNGQMEVVHEKQYLALLEKEGINPETPKFDQDWIDSAAHLAPVVFNETSDSNLHTRDCSSTFSLTTDKTERFVNWDVQMAPVVIGFGKGIDVSVASSYSVSNSVTGSAGVDIKAISERLGLTFGVDYSRTWTTQATVTVRGTIENGWTGTVITRPWTTRRSGRTFQGCPGSLKQTGTWIADAYEEGSYEGVKWVGGAITVCAKQQKEIPLSRCNGSGNFK
ncbi:hypothetical protein CkaCkLH20_10601 [Colletotrichum karsti]|uniref:Uncharacterized protein n=1 Tax=Colletotrichum karsti TaxID=1095194 RepID=A0A9P6HWT9_9PEZI|nr:uncharacterized protein CkaCkLH20_10601 [Colletotrichum karsti]KAF9871969.1 hypothetical protein CkaCkLH20_10601 [Colletotrichum karsti]